jgi:hypothetical protein
MHYLSKLRRKIFNWFRRNAPEGQALNWRLLIIYCLLFPIKALKWQLEKGDGYKWQSGVWVIHGMRYTDQLFEGFAFWDVGSKFKIVKRDEGYVTIERLQ